MEHLAQGPSNLGWIVRLLPRLDTNDEVIQLETVRNMRCMLADAGWSFSRLAGLIRVPRAPHLEDGAPVNTQTVGRLLGDEIDRVPLADQLWLGDLQKRLRRGDPPTEGDRKRIRGIRRAIAGAAA